MVATAISDCTGREVIRGSDSVPVDVFVLEPVTDRYLGRLCDFNTCRRRKAECRVPGCEEVTLLRPHEGFRWRSESLVEERSVRLFDRAAKLHRRAADLPLFESPMRGEKADDCPWSE